MKKTNKNTTLTPEQYIRQKARTLPLGQCYMNKNWFISGIATAVVCRCHKKGTYTFGVFQFDTFCTGLIDCKIEFSRDETAYNNIMAYLKDSFKIEPVTYQEVHNLIFGAVAYGEDAGFTPAPMFNLAKFLLEEDTEDIPLINYQFGRFGKHFLLADSEQELDEFMPHLIAHLGKENILFGIEGSDRYFKGEDFYDSETRKAMRQIASKIREEKQMPIEEYSYVHPTYPTELKLKHEEVGSLLYDPANRLRLSDEQINQLLALPHDELRVDLEQVLLYETGRTCDEVPTVELTDNGFSQLHSALIHALIFLGELGNEESLPTVLETMCQRKDFYDYQLGVVINETYVPTLYNIGKNQLDKFYDFLQIPGLYTYARYLIFPTVIQIAEREPERREEVIEWFHKVLQFYIANLAKNHCCDGSLVGLVATHLMQLKAEELLPELKVLFETGLVNEQCCGSYENVEAMMKQPNPYSIQYHFEIHERYEELRKGYDGLSAAHNNQILELMQNKAAGQTEDTNNTEVSETKNETFIEDAQIVKEIEDKDKSQIVTDKLSDELVEKDGESSVVPTKKRTTRKDKNNIAKSGEEKTSDKIEDVKKTKTSRSKKVTTSKVSKETKTSKKETTEANATKRTRKAVKKEAKNETDAETTK